MRALSSQDLIKFVEWLFGSCIALSGPRVLGERVEFDVQTVNWNLAPQSCQTLTQCGASGADPSSLRVSPPTPPAPYAFMF